MVSVRLSLLVRVRRSRVLFVQHLGKARVLRPEPTILFLQSHFRLTPRLAAHNSSFVLLLHEGVFELAFLPPVLRSLMLRDIVIAAQRLVLAAQKGGILP